MKFRYLAASIAFTIPLQGCGSSSDMEQVKNGIMDFNKTLTVGEAFDGWNECKEKNWTEFQTDNGQRVVQFSCSSRNVSPFMNQAKSILDGEGKQYDLSEVVSSFQWTINKDDTFQLQYIETSWKWADGKSIEVEGDNKLLNSVYNNEITFDMSALQDDESLNAVTTANAYALLVATLYSEAK